MIRNGFPFLAYRLLSILLILATTGVPAVCGEAPNETDAQKDARMDVASCDAGGLWITVPKEAPDAIASVIVLEGKFNIAPLETDKQ